MSTRPFQLAMLLAVAGLVVAATTAYPAEPAKLVTKVYQVADLVVPVPSTAAAEKSGKSVKPCPTMESELVQLIQYTVAPTTWQANGGAGSIEYFQLGMSLVINQTPDVQEQIMDLLATLRRDLNTEVVLEMRFLCAPEGFLKDNHIALSGKPGSSCVFMNDREVKKLMEAACADRGISIMQAPKLTMVNGQMVRMTLPGQLLGGANEDAGIVRILTQPIVSADRRFVRLFLNLAECANTAREMKPAGQPVHGCLRIGVGVNSEVGLTGSVVFNEQNFDVYPPVAFEKTATLPNGGTMLFGGWKKDVVVPVEQDECPVLSRIPYVNRLFRNVAVSCDSGEVYVLVTPRILMQEETEEIAPPYRGAEEQEEPVKLTPEQQRQATVVTGLLKAYDQACAAGHAAEARKYARAALAIDPTCFKR